MSKKNYLLSILTITVILHSSVTSAQEVKERAMVVYSKKKSLSQKQKYLPHLSISELLFS